MTRKLNFFDRFYIDADELLRLIDDMGCLCGIPAARAMRIWAGLSSWNGTNFRFFQRTKTLSLKARGVDQGSAFYLRNSSTQLVRYLFRESKLPFFAVAVRCRIGDRENKRLQGLCWTQPHFTGNTVAHFKFADEIIVSVCDDYMERHFQRAIYHQCAQFKRCASEERYQILLGRSRHFFALSHPETRNHCLSVQAWRQPRASHLSTKVTLMNVKLPPRRIGHAGFAFVLFWIRGTDSAVASSLQRPSPNHAAS